MRTSSVGAGQLITSLFLDQIDPSPIQVDERAICAIIRDSARCLAGMPQADQVHCWDFDAGSGSRGSVDPPAVCVDVGENTRIFVVNSRVGTGSSETGSRPAADQSSLRRSEPVIDRPPPCLQARLDSSRVGLKTKKKRRRPIPVDVIEPSLGVAARSQVDGQLCRRRRSRQRMIDGGQRPKDPHRGLKVRPSPVDQRDWTRPVDESDHTAQGSDTGTGAILPSAESISVDVSDSVVSGLRCVWRRFAMVA